MHERRSGGRLLLVGGGHAHLEVIRRFGRHPPPGVSAALVTPDAAHPYTGMLTGYLAGEYELDELTFALDALCEWAGVELVCDRADRLDGERRSLLLASGATLIYDAVSFDVGSELRGWDLPGIASQAMPVRPLERAVALAAALDWLETPQPAVVVVGGGAAGVELALAAQARLVQRGIRPRCLIVEERPALLADLGPRAGTLAQRLLELRGGRVLLGWRATAAVRGVLTVEPASSHGEPGSTGGHSRATDAVPDAHPRGRDGAAEHAFDLLVWATGPAAPRLFRDSGLPTDQNGYLAVDRSLASPVTGVFGAGDCVAIEGAPWLPKAGVYAVREAPVLWGTLRSFLTGTPAERPRYRPQRRFLYALNTGDGRALIGRGGWVCHNRAARRLKDWIDRRFVKRYIRLLDVRGGGGVRF